MSSYIIPSVNLFPCVFLRESPVGLLFLLTSPPPSTLSSDISPLLDEKETGEKSINDISEGSPKRPPLQSVPEEEEEPNVAEGVFVAPKVFSRLGLGNRI